MILNNLKFFKTNGLPLTIQITPSLIFKLGTSEIGFGSGAEGFIEIDRQGNVVAHQITKPGQNYKLSTQAVQLDNGLWQDPLGPIDRMEVFYNETFMFKVSLSPSEVLYKKEKFYLGHEERSYFSVAIVNLPEDNPLSLEPKYYPGVTISGNIDLEPVSTNLVSNESIFILEQKYSDIVENAKRPSEFKRPSDSLESSRKIAFSLNNKLIRFVTSDLESESLIWKNKQIFDLKLNEDKTKEPISFSVGFLGDVEGLYEEFMQVYLIDEEKDEDGHINEIYTNIGMIHVGAEAIDEDERYRTLFANFGIPDPKNYPTLFKEVNPKQEGTDWELINQKSKELFLTYTEIFPYVGTYKALINAVKFLGYNDIIFKEWFKYIGKDNQNNKFLTYQALDISLGSSLSSKLQKLNLQNNEVSDVWNTWFDYKKLNKLSMVYQINKETGKNEVINGVFQSGSNKEANEFIYEIPATENTYEYTNEEVLIKLFALKSWLEKYIIGVNCKISDITGEGVYFERYKNPAYPTHHYVVDFIKNIPLNPVPAVDSADDFSMIDSSALVKCTLREFKEARIQDYEQFSFEQFINMTYNMEPSALTMNSTVGRTIVPKGIISDSEYDVYNELHLPIGAPFNTPLLANEIQYSLDIKTNSGSILNSIKKTIDGSVNPILVRDNEITIWNDDVDSCEFEKCPTIQIADGVFRKKFGPIQESVVYRVTSAFDPSTQGYRYMMFKDTSSNNFYLVDQNKYARTKLVSYDYITLVPRENASFKYQISPKYEVPVFYIKNYDVILYNTEMYGENDDRVLDASSSCYLGDSEFILDIYNGTITCDEGENIEAHILFSDEHIDVNSGNSEQEIVTNYIYNSKKTNPWVFDFNSYKDQHGKLVLDMTSDINHLKTVAQEKVLQAEQAIDASRDASIAALVAVNQNNPNWDYENDPTWKMIWSEASAMKLQVKDDISENFEHLKNLRVGVYEQDKNNLIKDSYTINEFIDVSVNHIGEYQMSVKGWDQFGMIYTNKSQVSANVYADAPKIFVSTPYSNSNNASDFYRTNKKGILLDVSSWHESGSLVYSKDYQHFLDNSSPRFLPNHRIYGIDSSGLDIFTYPTSSYSIDTPKKGDYLLVENLSERVLNIDFDYKINITETGYEKEKVGLKLQVLDENTNANNVFMMDASVNLYFYDPTKLSLYSDNANTDGISGKYQVVGFFKAEQDNDEANNNYLKLVESTNSAQFKDLSDKLIEKVNTGKIKCFVSNVTEYDIDLKSIENDYDNEESTFVLSNSLIKDNMAFEPGQVIKIFFARDAELGNQNIEDYIASASYRIKRSEVFNDAPLDENGEPTGYIYKQRYVVDGIINKELVTEDWYHYTKGDKPVEFDKALSIRATYANSLFVQYVLEMKEDTVENKGYGTIHFNNDWLISDYIDSTYSYYTSKFIPEDAYNDWLTERILLYADLYEYDIPATLLKGNQYRVTSRYQDKRSLKQYKSIWSLYTNAEKMNRLRWQITNPFIYAKASEKGEYQFKLEAIDVYGNLVTNEGEAVMFSK
jgi:hypothetical protein